MSQHTPEPWVTYQKDEGRSWIIRATGTDDDLIATVESSGGTNPIIDAITVSNAARIIACINGCTGLNPTAYRECVEALKLIISIIPDGNSPSHLKAKQAVAHAEGKEE